MIGKRVSHYEIRSKLGAGGMGVVYRAHDTTLGRDVALKFLPADLTGDDAARARFIHEARAAAALEHPNICTVYEVGEADGAMFIAMPLVEGESLRDKIASGPVPVDEAIELALGVARGLSKAHSHGIVHRDIKPGNVLLTTDGQAKIVDFGLAKLATQTRLTKTGMTVGTVSYMSPEQAKGDDVDHRTDVWALGVVLYEMLAGKRPFRGDADAAVVYSILNTDPEPVTAVRREVPVALEDVAEKALSRDPDKRYQTVDEMIEALETVREESRLGIDRRHYAVLKRLKRRKRLMAGSATLVVVAIAAILLTTFSRQGQALDTLAVLPLENLSGDEGQDIFAEGITGELITNFQRLGGLEKVISRSASMRYKDTDKSPREIASELDVKVLVGGMIQIQGDNVRITAELIDGATEELIWSGKFEGQLRDFLFIQGQIARAIADEINLRLTPEEAELLAVDRPVDREAYEAYLWGLKHIYFFNPDRIRKATESFEKSIAIDSTFAPAYASLSFVNAHFIRDYDKAETLANRALELDPRSPQAHVALATILMTRDRDWEGTEREIALVEEMVSKPCDVPEIALFYLLGARMDLAVGCALHEVETDPTNPDPLKMLAVIYRCASRPEEAIAAGRKVLEFFPDNQDAVESAWKEISAAYTMMGLPDSAIAIAGREGFEISAQTYAAAGMLEPVKEQLEATLKAWEDRNKPSSSLSCYIAGLYGYLGDNDKAFEWLDKAYEGRAWLLMYLNNAIGEGELDNLLEDPRLTDLMERMGYPRNNIAQRLASIEKYQRHE